MLDLGIINRGKTEDYQIKFLNEITAGEEISGKIYIGEIRKREMEKTGSYEFYVIITDHEDGKKWIYKLVTSYYPENGNIYGERDGRVYIFIDSLNHAVNNEPRNQHSSYSVNFNIFRMAVNDNISKVTAKAISPVNPHAKYVNLEVITAQCKKKAEKNVTLEDVAYKNPVIGRGYFNLQGRGEEITVKSIAFELKSLLNQGEITEILYKNALKDLDSVAKTEQ
jgi:hypothetical protein